MPYVNHRIFTFPSFIVIVRKSAQFNLFLFPDCSRNDLPELFKQLGFTTGAEIGVYTGTNLVNYLKAGLTMYGVDPYLDYEIPSLKPTTPPTMQFLGPAFKGAEHLKKYPNYIQIKKSSMDALMEFPDCSLDFVYIDGSHKYGHVAMDLTEWAQKIKKGGVLSGHDYYCDIEYRANRGVRPAVDGFVKAFGIKNFWILGGKHPKEGEKRDPSLSFMMFKYW